MPWRLWAARPGPVSLKSARRFPHLCISAHEIEMETLKRFGAVIGLAIALALTVAACGNTTQHELVGPSTALELVETPPAGLVVLDVRTPDEHSQAHIEGSALIDFYSPTFQNELAALDREVPYLLYCRSGNRSAETVRLMKDLGFSEVFELEGGIQSWALQGLPLVSS